MYVNRQCLKYIFCKVFWLFEYILFHITKFLLIKICEMLYVLDIGIFAVCDLKSSHVVKSTCHYLKRIPLLLFFRTRARSTIDQSEFCIYTGCIEIKVINSVFGNNIIYM